MLGDLNGWVGDRLRVGINEDLGIPEEKDNGIRVINFDVERSLSVSSTLSTRMHKYTKMEWR